MGLYEFTSEFKKITPERMGFDIRTPNLPDKIYERMIFSYTVRPLFGIQTRWVTEITHVRDKSYFVDEQRVGPYKLWHHQHIIPPENNGVLMKDIVSNQPRFGVFGMINNGRVIRNTLNEIFDFRTKAPEKIFPL